MELSIIFFVYFLKVSAKLPSAGLATFPLTRVGLNFSECLTKRKYHLQPLWNDAGAYKIDFMLGTPPQNMEAIIDTGSSDFIVISGSVLEKEPTYSREFPKFDETYSSTFKSNFTKFNLTYIMGAYSEGIWAQDCFSSYDTNIPNFNFGLAHNTNHDFTVGGIGLAINESPLAYGDMEKPYSNFLMQLKEAGSIKHMAYSLWLNSESENLGYITFGGMDKSLLASDLYRFPLVKSMDFIKNAFTIKLDKIYLIDYDNRHQLLADTSLPVLFDSGTAISRLPQAIMEELYNGLGATQIGGNRIVPCHRLTNGGGIGLVFSGVELSFAFEDIAVSNDLDGRTCVLGFIENDTPIIGINILRLLYVVYDLENMELGLAMAKVGADAYQREPERVAITKSIEGIKAPDYSNTEVLYRLKPYRVKFRPHKWQNSRVQNSLAISTSSMTSSYIQLGYAARS